MGKDDADYLIHKFEASETVVGALAVTFIPICLVCIVLGGCYIDGIWKAETSKHMDIKRTGIFPGEW